MARKIIAILRGIDPSDAVHITREMIEAGIELIEVPLNSPDAFSSIKQMRKAFDGKAQIGAGTVLSINDVDDLKAVGGQFVVSPDCNPEIIKQTKKRGMASYPGVFTATECFSAIRAGADGLKLFPASILGPGGLKALKAVLPKKMDCYAVGGAGPENFEQWRAAGADGFGIGSAIFKPGDDLKSVRKKADAIVKAYDKVFGDAG